MCLFTELKTKAGHWQPCVPSGLEAEPTTQFLCHFPASFYPSSQPLRSSSSLHDAHCTSGPLPIGGGKSPSPVLGLRSEPQPFHVFLHKPSPEVNTGTLLGSQMPLQLT